MPQDQDMLTVEQAAKRANVSRSQIYMRIASGEIESVKIGHLRRIPVDALDRWYKGLREAPAPFVRPRKS